MHSDMADKNKKIGFVLAVIKALFGCFYVFFAAELFLRIFSPEPILPRYVTAGADNIRTNVPDKSYWHKTPEYRINIRTNSKGIRSDCEISYEKPRGVKRIVVLGDSFAMGYGVSLEDTFLRKMREGLESKGKKVEIVNMAVSGFGNAEELIKLKNEGVLYEPDLVILAFHYTDFADNVRSGLYGLEDGELVRRGESYLPGVEMRDFLFQFGIYRFAAEDLHLYALLREKAAYTIKKILVALKSDNNDREQDKQGAEEAARAARAYQRKLSLELLEEIRQVSRENGAELLILDIPVRKGRSRFAEAFPAKEPGFDSFKYYSPIEDFKGYAGKKLYWEKSHGHFTPLGCKIVGEGLAEKIFEDGLL